MDRNCDELSKKERFQVGTIRKKEGLSKKGFKKRSRL